MLRGDLSSMPFEQVLLRLADDGATGCLHVDTGSDAHGMLHLRDGLVHAASLDTRAPGGNGTAADQDTLGARLVAAGLVSTEQLLDAERARATELTHWSLPELLVHLGHVEEERVADAVRERALDAAGQICSWNQGTWRFRRGERTRQLLPEPLSVAGLLAVLHGRATDRDRLLEDLGGALAVPVRRADADPAGDDAACEEARSAFGTDGSALLGLVDGARTLTDLEGSYGMTGLEVLRLIQAMRDRDLLTVVPGPPVDDNDAQRWVALDLHDLAYDGTVSATGLLLEEDTAADGRPSVPSLHEDVVDDLPDAVVQRSLDIATGALGHIITYDPAESGPAGPEEERRQRIRAAAAAELALAHAEAETERIRRQTERAQREAESAARGVDERTPTQGIPTQGMSTQRPVHLDGSPVGAVDELLLARNALGLTLDPGAYRTEPFPAPLPPADQPVSPAAAPEAAPAAAPAPAPVASPASPARAEGLTDTAALMRELSSLGLDQDGPAARPVAPPAPPHPRAAAPEPLRPRRRGRFGR